MERNRSGEAVIGTTKNSRLSPAYAFLTISSSCSGPEMRRLRPCDVKFCFSISQHYCFARLQWCFLFNPLSVFDYVSNALPNTSHGFVSLESISFVPMDCVILSLKGLEVLMSLCFFNRK